MQLHRPVKPTILKSDPECPYLVATSVVYDTNLVHFLSISCCSI
jgi:hypothetical protein